MSTIIMTRHLYIKFYVERSLNISLLKKQTDASKFWGYEIYFSGFKKDVFIQLLFIYYNFYLYFYPNLENFILKQIDNWNKYKKNDLFLGNIIENICHKNSCPEFIKFKNNEEIWKEYEIIAKIKKETDVQKSVLFFQEFIDEINPIEQLSFHNLLKVYSILKQIFDIEIGQSSENSEFYEIIKDIIILKILNIIYLRNNSIKYLDESEETIFELQKEEIFKYKTKPFVYGKGWKIAKNNCLYTICREPIKFLGNFSLRFSPDEYDKNTDDCLKKREWYEVYDKWLYYASYSPIWSKRIIKYGGTTNEVEKKIIFPSEETEEAFYEWFNYEPDEQPTEILWRWFGLEEE